MNTLDIIILLLLIADIWRGVHIGLSRQLFSFVGFWGGLFLAALLAPSVASYGDNSASKLLYVAATLIIVTVVLSSVGEYLGLRLAGAMKPFRINHFDAGLGGLFGALLVFLTVWIGAAMFMNMPHPLLRDQIQRSQVVRLVNGLLPPAPPVIAKIQRVIDPFGFPQVFVGPEPTPGTVAGGATQEEIAAAIAAARASTVQIEGFGCGSDVTGSGFVAASGLVITNAHVVAGIERPLVFDRNGVYQAVPVLFDPDMDLAILRVSNLNGSVLPMSSSYVPSGTHSVVLGFPEGGPFTAAGGAVIRNYYATGRNIYNEGLSVRRVYELQADVRPGNSGGPLLKPDGTVIGVIFARSGVNENIGFALASPTVLPRLGKVQNSSARVSTGPCTVD